jgi:competence protein ComEC
VSAGTNNRYGHPHKEVVERLGALSIPMLNTAVEGNVVFESDGKKLEHK